MKKQKTRTIHSTELPVEPRNITVRVVSEKISEQGFLRGLASSTRKSNFSAARKMKMELTDDLGMPRIFYVPTYLPDKPKQGVFYHSKEGGACQICHNNPSSEPIEWDPHNKCYACPACWAVILGEEKK